jgi:hypothetical protein
MRRFVALQASKRLKPPLYRPRISSINFVEIYDSAEPIFDFPSGISLRKTKLFPFHTF